MVGQTVSHYRVLDTLGGGEEILAALPEIDCPVWDLQQLRASSPLLTGSPDGWSDHVEDQDVCLVLSMEVAGGASFYRSLGLERAFRDIQGARFHPLQEKPQQRFSPRKPMLPRPG